jgi:hypothetical protein
MVQLVYPPYRIVSISAAVQGWEVVTWYDANGPHLHREPVAVWAILEGESELGSWQQVVAMTPCDIGLEVAEAKPRFLGYLAPGEDFGNAQEMYLSEAQEEYREEQAEMTDEHHG